MKRGKKCVLGFGSFLILKMIISYLIVMIIVLNMKVFFYGKKVKVFERTWSVFFLKVMF